MPDLFNEPRTESSGQPLAARMRPRAMDEFLGQEHILGKDKLLRRLIESDKISSVILYGPPGCGKTTFLEKTAEALEVVTWKASVL